MDADFSSSAVCDDLLLIFVGVVVVVVVAEAGRSCLGAIESWIWRAFLTATPHTPLRSDKPNRKGKKTIVQFIRPMSTQWTIGQLEPCHVKEARAREKRTTAKSASSSWKARAEPEERSP